MHQVFDALRVPGAARPALRRPSRRPSRRPTRASRSPATVLGAGRGRARGWPSTPRRAGAPASHVAGTGARGTGDVTGGRAGRGRRRGRLVRPGATSTRPTTRRVAGWLADPAGPRRCTTRRARCWRSPRTAGRWPASPATPRCRPTSRCPTSAPTTWPTWRCATCTASCAPRTATGRRSADLRRLADEEADGRAGRRCVRARAVARPRRRARRRARRPRRRPPLLRDVELPLVEVLAAMERTGIAVDTDHLAQLEAHFAGEVKAAADEAYAVIGKEINLGSPKQLQVRALRRARHAEDQADQDRLHHRRRRAAGAVRADRAPVPRRTCCGTATSTRLKIDGRRAAQDGRRRRAHPHHVQPDDRGDRPAVVDRPEPAEHPDPHRGGPPDPRGVRRRRRATRRC